MKNYLYNIVENWLDSFPKFEEDETLKINEENFRKVSEEFSERIKNNYPFHHPLYAGQMLKSPHKVAIEAYSAMMMINPNNHALDGGPATAEMEKEVIQDFADLFGYKHHLGHLTTSGTIANFEALLIAREIYPEKAIAFSEQAHYTHSRVCSWLKIQTKVIPSDAFGKMDLTSLEDNLESGEIGTVVVTLGTTSLGAIDDLKSILELKKKYNFRIHIDAAYGGYFKVISNSFASLDAFNLIQYSDSITFDPHKQGLQPYGSGCVLFSDPSVGKYYKHDSPYTYFTSKELHLGEISVECSRAGAAAAAIWFTNKLFPLKDDEGFGPILKKTILAARKFAELIRKSEKYKLYIEPETNIVTYFPKAKTSQEISELSENLMMRLMNENKLWLATLKLNSYKFKEIHPDVEINSENVTILRSCIMKPEQFNWIETIVNILEKS